MRYTFSMGLLNNEDIFDPPTINRNALIIVPKQPFLDWLHDADPTSHHLVLSDLRMEPNICLIPECDNEDAAVCYLKRCYEPIFIDHLNGWYRDEDTWPAKRTFKLFREWFEWTYHSMLVDLTNEVLEHEVY